MSVLGQKARGEGGGEAYRLELVKYKFRVRSLEGET